MSSNTLRGIGQEEDGDTNATASGKGVAKAAAAPTGPAGTAIVEATTVGDTVPTAGDLTERIPEPQKLASLDSSVPDARSSLDAKVPHLAATLMGVMAPQVNTGNREKGTVQGRDVHLPAESQRLAGVRTVADDVSAPGSGATPQLIERSEPTRADPVRTAVLAHAANDRAGALRGQTRAVDSNSHGPWYDQDPTGGNDVYEDEKPSVVGRAAIGVAVAAGLSVVVFAVLRMTANSEDGDRRPPPVVYEPSSLSARPAPPAPTSSAAIPETYLPDGKPSAAAAPGHAPAPTEAPAATGGPARPREPAGSVRPAATGAGAGSGSTGRPTVVRVGPGGAHSGSRAVTPARAGAADDFSRVGTSSPGGAVISAPPASHIAGTAPSSPSFPSSHSLAPSDVAAPTPPPSKPAASSGTDKVRGKSYDPDSTLPLNLD
ncbi:MAG: hypothetical protein ABJA82_10265 [Myxococcales bacterium]